MAVKLLNVPLTEKKKPNKKKNTLSVTIQTIHNDQTLPKSTCNGKEKGAGIKLANYRR